MSDIPIKLPVRAEFDEYGGYDCMSGAWRIIESGRLCSLFSLDCSDFCDDPKRAHESNVRVEKVKDFIVESLNLRMPIAPISQGNAFEMALKEQELIKQAEEASGKFEWGIEE